MRLVKQDILNIDNCLRRNDIKYIDVRYELIDHLVSEYEAMDNYPDLGSFLSERMPWCREIAEKKRKSIHWNNLKMVGRMCLTVLKNTKTWLSVLLFGTAFFIFSGQFSTKVMRWFLMAPLFLCVIAQIYYLGVISLKTKGSKELLSLTYLINLFALPQFFLWGIGGWLPKELLHNYYFIAPYILIGTLVNFAAIQVFLKKRSTILEEYKFLKTYMA